MNSEIFKDINLTRNVGVKLNKYKVNIIYSDNKMSLEEIIIKAITQEILMICNTGEFNVL